MTAARTLADAAGGEVHAVVAGGPGIAGKAEALGRSGADVVVTLEHAVAMFDAIPGAEFAVVPGTSHFLTQEKPHLVNALVLDFLTNEPVPTVAPIRRAQVASSQR